MLSLIAAPLIAASPPRLTVDYAVSASKAIQGTVRVASEQWLVFSPDMRIHSSQEWQTLQPRTKPSQTGTDAFGRYDEINIAWSDDRGASIFTAIRSYAGSPGLAVCTTTFLSGVSNTSVDTQKDQPILGFPSFQLDGAAMPRLGYGLWYGLWPTPRIAAGLNSTDALGVFSRHDGPVVFTSHRRMSLLVGPVDDVMNTVYRAPSTTSSLPSLAFGPSGRLSQVEAGYTYSVALITGNGPTDAIERYGDVLKRSRGVDSATFERLSDASVTKVSYWTDNGAFYFVPNVDSAGEMLPKVLDRLSADGVNIGLLQLDGWWPENPYVKPRSDYFPDWDAFRKRLGNRGLLLYKSYFGQDDDLFSQFPCKVESTKTGWWYPCSDSAFAVYSRLFVEGKKLGMTAYETDFMSDHMLATPGLSNSTSGLPRSLASMAEAGRQHGIPMQWCMPTAATVLHAVNLSAVSNARGSPDYATEGPEDETMDSGWSNTYMVGGAGLLFWAVDLPLSKDLTWTTTHQPGSPKNATQPNVELDTAMAVLSMGPVGIGDGIGLTNVSLVNRTCRADGVLLKPSKVVTAIDSTFVPSQGTQAKPFLGFLPMTADGDCTAKRPCSPSAFQTHSEIHGIVWHQLVTLHLGTFHPQLSDFYPPLAADSFVMRESRWRECSNNSDVYAAGCAHLVVRERLPDISSGPHRLDSKGAVAWKLFTLSPVLSNGWALLGETSKFVPVSPQRFLSVRPHGACLQYTAFASKGEVVRVAAVSPSGRCLIHEAVGKCDNEEMVGQFC